MARNKTRFIQHKRRRQGKTDYRLRLKLIKSGKPRFVVRKSSNNMICQVVKHNAKGDITMVSSDSRELAGLGWKFHRGNVPAAYLTGFLCGSRAVKNRITSAILDAGLYTSTKGSRIYAAVKGAVDAGMEIPVSKDILPAEGRIMGKHINEKIAAEVESIKKKKVQQKPKIHEKE